MSEIMRNPISLLVGGLFLALNTLQVTSAARTCSQPYVADTVYVGCYTDPVNPRTLSSVFLNPDTLNTPQYCADFCASGGYTYSGVEYST
jgi:hypothetical protein